MRKCSRCSLTKPDIDFRIYFDKRRNRHYLRAECRKCETVNALKWQKTPEGIAYQRQRTTLEGRAKRLKYALQWQKTPAGKEQRRRWRKSEKGIASRKKWNEIWRKTEAGKIQRLRIKKRYALRKRIGTAAESKLTYSEWLELLVIHNFKCVYCGTDISENPTMDHVIPISKGGPHSINNVVPSCIHCNKRKSNKDLRDFLDMLFTKAT